MTKSEIEVLKHAITVLGPVVAAWLLKKADEVASETKALLAQQSNN